MYNFQERYAGYKRGVSYLFFYSVILFVATTTKFWQIKTLIYFLVGSALSGIVAVLIMTLQYNIENRLNPRFWILNIAIDIFGYFAYTYYLFSIFF
jgi:H+/Cl- antiporter ClcA